MLECEVVSDVIVAGNIVVDGDSVWDDGKIVGADLRLPGAGADACLLLLPTLGSLVSV